MYVHRGYTVAVRGLSKSLALRTLQFQLRSFVLFAMVSGITRHFKDISEKKYHPLNIVLLQCFNTGKSECICSNNIKFIDPEMFLSMTVLFIISINLYWLIPMTWQ